MVITTIFICFLNYMLKYVYFTFIIWISYLWNTCKIIQPFILLSGLRAFISNAIFERNQSFNFTSTASQLIFAHSLTFLHSATHSPSPSPPPASAANVACRPGHEPLPSLEGCGLNQHRSSSLTSEDAAAAAPPLSKGMWAVWTRSSEDPGLETDEGRTHEHQEKAT